MPSIAAVAPLPIDPDRDVEASRSSLEEPGTHAPVFEDDDEDDKKDTATTTTAELPLPAFLAAPSSRVRRRSELAFARHGHGKLAAGIETSMPPAFELSGMPTPIAEDAMFAVQPLGAQTPAVEPSRAPSLNYADSAPLTRETRTPMQKRLGWLHFTALCWAFFVEGWNDGTTGPLLPRFQAYYGIGFVTVSTIFIMNAVGFIAGAFLIVPLEAKFGFGTVIVMGATVQMLAYALEAPGGPFPLYIVAFGFIGFGLALQNALGNAYVGSVKFGKAWMLGVLHGTYGVGAFLAPLAATYFSQQRHWSYHYLISLGFALINVLGLCAVFRFHRQDVLMAEAGQHDLTDSTESHQEGNANKYRAMLGIRTVYYLIAFAILYIGIEASLGGWIVTFIQRERGGGASSGYISSGFFGGLALGRVGLLQLNKLIGETRALTIYAVLCIGLEITIWVVPSLVENAVAVSAIGMMFGPMYPILVNHSSKILPRGLLSFALGLITGLGQVGSALLPFFTGLLAARFGISSLQPLVVSMMSVMTVLWLLVPKTPRRVD